MPVVSGQTVGEKIWNHSSLSLRRSPFSKEFLVIPSSFYPSFTTVTFPRPAIPHLLLGHLSKIKFSRISLDLWLQFFNDLKNPTLLP